MADRDHQERTRPSRTKARKQALDLLFESEFRDLDLEQALTEKAVDIDRPVRDYAATLVRGVAEHRDAISTRIRDHLSGGWTLARLPRVDRVVLLIAVFEIDHCDNVPDAVAISEALGLVGELSTDESSAFVNGLLGAIVDSKGAVRPS